MARKLKVYTTSIGFFDLAIAAPSMKAALDAWGADSNLFHQNFAREVHDAATVEATLAHPGIVLRRPVGSNKPFSETSELPDDLVSPAPKTRISRGTPSEREKSPSKRKTDAKKASAAYERKERKKAAEARRDEAKRVAAKAKRDAAVEKVEASLRTAEADHNARASEIARERAALDAREHAEADRWDKAKRKLELSLKKAKKLG